MKYNTAYKTYYVKCGNIVWDAEMYSFVPRGQRYYMDKNAGVVAAVVFR
jgi:hypothetical protein